MLPAACLRRLSAVRQRRQTTGFAGIVTVGYKTIATVGSKIVALKPSSAFAVQSGATLAVLLSTAAGMPVSTSHCLGPQDIHGHLFAPLLRGLR